MKNKLYISKTVKLAFVFLLSIVIFILYLFIPKLQGFEVTAVVLDTAEAAAGVWCCGFFLLFFCVCDCFGVLIHHCFRRYRRLKHPEKPLTVREQAQDLRDLPDEKLVALVKQNKRPVDPMSALVSEMVSALSRSMSDRVPPRSDEGGDQHEN